METIDPSTTLARVGQPAPFFRLTTLDGREIRPADALGRVLVVHWFTLDCPSCLSQLPYIETEIWSRWSGGGLVFVAGVRDADKDAARAFRDDKGFTMPLAPDPLRAQYNLFATMHVPRTCVIDPRGIVARHTAGFDEDSLVATLEHVARLMSP